MIFFVYLLRYFVQIFILALIGYSEEVRSRCHVKHSIPRYISDSLSQENFLMEPNPQFTVTQQPTTTISTTVFSSNTTRRQKSCDYLEHNVTAHAKATSTSQQGQVCDRKKNIL